MSVLSRLRQVIGRTCTSEWYWLIIAAVLVSACVYSASRQFALAAEARSAMDNRAEALAGVADGYRELSQSVGRSVRWAEDLRAEQPGPLASGRYRAIAIIDAQQCANTTKSVTQFLSILQFSSRRTWDLQTQVIAVVMAPERQTATSYREANNFTFPILFDSESRFVKDNELKVMPVVLIVDAHDRIVLTLSTANAAAQLWPALTRTAVSLLGASEP